eukprot:171850-Chlamydomonas_euryale.AAC.2
MHRTRSFNGSQRRREVIWPCRKGSASAHGGTLQPGCCASCACTFPCVVFLLWTLITTFTKQDSTSPAFVRRC